MSNGVTISTVNNGASIAIVGLGGGSASGSSFAHIAEASGNVYINTNTLLGPNIELFPSIAGVAGQVNIKNTINSKHLELTFDGGLTPTIYSLQDGSYPASVAPLSMTAHPLLLNAFQVGNVGIWTDNPSDKYALDAGAGSGNFLGLETSTIEATIPVIGDVTPDEADGLPGVLQFNNDDNSAYFQNTDVFSFSIYAYKIGINATGFSTNPYVVTNTGNGDNSNSVNLFERWSAVDGANGYRVVVNSDPQYADGGGFTGYYFDTPFTQFILGSNDFGGVGSDENSGGSYLTAPINGYIPTNQTSLQINSNVVNMSNSQVSVNSDFSVLNHDGQTIFNSYEETDSHFTVYRWNQFSYTGVNYPDLFDAGHLYVAGLPIFRLNGASPSLWGGDTTRSTSENRGYVEIASAYGSGGALGVIMEFLPRRNTSYSTSGQNGIFMHPLKMDGFGHMFMGDIPENEHTLYKPSPAWVCIRPSTADAPQLLLSGNGVLHTGNMNGALECDKTYLYGTQSGIRSKLISSYDLTSGSFKTSITNTTGTTTYTIPFNYNGTVIVSGQKIVSLPSVSSVSGFSYTIKQVAAGATGTITGAGTLIDGALNYALTGRYNAVTVQSDGLSWWITAKV